ncbi:DUF2844 domain-containing protein [Paraburkholderia metrosideri]|jgi:hypothetical protein|uniref:DUF2844 domain-containing protein n=1 Tax=Paraburkholderia metrosideri TaxID=580937 RepID=A0ABN7HNA8_9BURK|nr:DUF2844 domain-containing protein [Paraburkholderia metrosideri]CAD6523981.1 hypothetical protein LMG28140_01551 [Paraburkholderia metrosideri]
MRCSKIAILAAALLPLISHASLGGAPNVDVAAPVSRLAAPPSEPPVAPGRQAAARYSMHQSLDANGVTIREFVLPSNVVFAVTWDGPIRPDMTALLGRYFPNYVNVAQSHARGTGPLVDGDDSFRIESTGRLGRFSGMAWLPREMPASVRPGDLQ